MYSSKESQCQNIYRIDSVNAGETDTITTQQTPLMGAAGDCVILP